ncbi:MAG TPA: hypothetical protein VN580_06120 [Clostridia bacterium]|nr:hypothetical protein [Clostridia bacterium]
MKLILVISFLIPLAFIWYLISALGVFLDNNAIPPANSMEPAGSIILGSSGLAEKIAGLLQEKGFRVIRPADPFQLIQEKRLCYLFALSESDADNIAFSKIGKKLYCIKKSISICNDRRNESMFVNEKVNYVLVGEASAEKLIQMVLPQPEVDCEHKYE